MEHFPIYCVATEAHKRQLAMDRAGRRQRLQSETAEEREARLQNEGELVEGGVLHLRLPNSERHASLDRRGRRRANAESRLTQRHSSLFCQ